MPQLSGPRGLPLLDEVEEISQARAGPGGDGSQLPRKPPIGHPAVWALALKVDMRRCVLMGSATYSGLLTNHWSYLEMKLAATSVGAPFPSKTLPRLDLMIRLITAGWA
eukprot:1864935-Alexandrium_andersonii.AAC.1